MEREREREKRRNKNSRERESDRRRKNRLKWLKGQLEECFCWKWINFEILKVGDYIYNFKGILPTVIPII